MSQELEGTLTNTANLVGTFGSEGGGGTTNYNDLINKPSINSVTLQGNKTASQLGFAEVATSGNYNDLTNKPTIPAAQVNSDWNATSGVAEILNKPTIPAAQVNSDWNASSGVAQILNKPTVYQNASELPISSSDPTDTKTYIDTGLSGLIKTATVSGTTTASGALEIPNTIPYRNVLATQWNGTGIQKFAFPRGDNYLQVLWNDGTTLKPFANEQVSFLVTYY